jgi:hypothetical protein
MSKETPGRLDMAWHGQTGDHRQERATHRTSDAEPFAHKQSDTGGAV